MNYRNMTFEELVREAAYSDDLLALELVKRIDFDVLLDFFNDVVEWVGINDAWLEKRETVKLALEAIQEAMPID